MSCMYSFHGHCSVLLQGEAPAGQGEAGLSLAALPASPPLPASPAPKPHHSQDLPLVPRRCARAATT